MTRHIRDQVRGLDLLILNWRDVRHPQAGGAEQYMHQIARRWVAEGARVTWLTAQSRGTSRREVLDGIEIVRVGGTLTVYLYAALRLLWWGRRFDAIVDCQNGIPFFSPMWTWWCVPVVQVMHHVHQDQFATRFSRPMASVGRFLESKVARRVYGRRAIAAVSASTREEIRARLGLNGPVFVVPNGTVTVPAWYGSRDPDPAIVVVTRLVPHKRIDLLLQHIATTAALVPRLHVDVVGDGPILHDLRNLSLSLGLAQVVTFHGRQPDHVRDELLQRAWLTASTSAGEGWGCSVLEAAAWGVPCLAVAAPGIRDAVVHGQTGWLVEEERYGEALVGTLRRLADEGSARRVSQRCQSWARCFTWERSAGLLAGVVSYQIGADGIRRRSARRRQARPDITAVVDCRTAAPTVFDGHLRATDQVHVVDGGTRLLLGGCDEFDAAAVLRRIGFIEAQVRLADRYDLLAGPQGMPQALITPLRRTGPRPA